VSESEPPAPTQRVSIDDLGLSTAGEAAAKEAGNAFLYAWFQLFKTAQIHAIDNQALRRPVANFAELTGRTVSREGKVSFQAKDRALFLNSVKLKLSSEEFEYAYDIFEFFEERGMGGFVVDGALDQNGVHRLLQIMVYAPPANRQFKTIGAALQEAGLPFRINKSLGTGKRGTSEMVLERRAYTFFTYSKLVVLYRSLLAEEELKPIRRQYLCRKIARTVQALVDICLEDDHTFLGVSAVKSGDAYAPHHAANVTVLSIVLGEKLGLSKVDLADLGMAAVFCDIGLKLIPREIVDKQGPLDQGERVVMERHPLRSVEFLLGEGVFSKSVLTRIATAFEHHRNADGNGYPPMSRPPDLFSRIVSIAEAYDALTTDRPWGKAYLPDETLGYMISEAGQRFDSVLLKIFVNTLGLYPVGTLVRLTTGELAVVVYGGGEGERATRPVVALLGPDGRPAKTVDLTATDAAGSHLRSVVSSEDPSKYGLQPSGLLAGSAPVPES